MAAVNRNPFIDYSPKIEKKPTRDAGEVTSGRTESLKAAKELKKEKMSNVAKKQAEFNKMTPEERMALNRAIRQRGEARIED